MKSGFLNLNYQELILCSGLLPMETYQETLRFLIFGAPQFKYNIENLDFIWVFFFRNYRVMMRLRITTETVEHEYSKFFSKMVIAGKNNALYELNKYVKKPFILVMKSESR